MTDTLLRMLLWTTIGLVLALLLRRPARRAFGAGAAFALWLLPVALMAAPWLPHGLAPAATWSLPALLVTPHVGAAAYVAAPVDWARWLFVLWLVGASLGLARLAAHYLHLLRGMRDAPAAWATWLAQAAPGLDPRRVRVHAAGPAVLWALPRALILLPADFLERFDNPATRELVLRHELTHARRGDACWSLAMEIASALLWFHPLAWLARSRFCLDLELACDAASLRALPNRTASYARALLDSTAARPMPALIPWLAEPQLKERIAMFTHIPPGALRRRAGFLAIAVLLGGGLLLAGGQTPVEAATQGSSASTPPAVDVTYKNANPPEYPAEALREGQQGVVILRVEVDAKGDAQRVEIDPKGTTAPVDLQQAAVDGALHWKFNPGRRDGKAVGGWISIPVTFSLHELQDCPAGEAHAEVAPFQCVHVPALPASPSS